MSAQPATSTGPEILSLSNRHEAILEALIAHPHRTHGDIARMLGYTDAWFSIIIHSDVFQARYRERMAGVYDETQAGIREKLEAVAHCALDKLGNVVATTQDEKLVADIADKTLHRLGFAPNKGPAAPVFNQQNNFFPVEPAQLAQARQLMHTKAGQQAPENLPTLAAPSPL